MNEQRVRWHQYTVDAVEKQLNTKASCGLSRKEARARYRRYGANTLYDPQKREETALCRRILSEPSVILFLFACLLCALFDDWREAVFSLGCACALFALIFLLQSHIKKLHRHVSQYRIPTAVVLRDGHLYPVSVRNVVKGDVLLLRAGDLVPCDCRLVRQSQDLRVLALSLDPDEQQDYRVSEKNARLVYPYGSTIAPYEAQNMLYAGSEIACGECLAIAVEIGASAYVSSKIKCQIPAEKPRPKRGVYEALLPYLRLYSLLSFVLFGILSVISFFTPTKDYGITKVFLSLSALLTLAAQTVWESCFCLLDHHTKKGCFADGTQSRTVLLSDHAATSFSAVTDLFVFGHSAFSDGKRHFYRAIGGKGEIDPENDTEEILSFLEPLFLYRFAEQRRDRDDTRVDRHEVSRQELLNMTHYDPEALRMRYENASYELIGDGAEEVLWIRHGNADFQLIFSESTTDALACTHCLCDRRTVLWEGSEKAVFAERIKTYRRQGCHILHIFKLCKGVRSLIGSLILREKLQENILETVEALQKRNVQVTCFLCENEEDALAYSHALGLSDRLMTRSKAGNNHARLNELYGKYRVFSGFSISEIHHLMVELKKHGHRIAYLGNQREERVLMRASFCSVVCDSVAYHTSQAEHSLYERYTTCGDVDDQSCSQAMRRSADAVVSRADHAGGGLRSVLSAIDRCRIGEIKKEGFAQFLILSQISPLVMAVLLTLLGCGHLGGAQLLFSGWLTSFVYLILLLHASIVPEYLNRFRGFSAKKLGKALCTRVFWIPPLGASLLAAAIGTVLFFTDLISKEACGAYCFCSVVLIQMLSFLSVIRATGIRPSPVRCVASFSAITLLLLLFSVLSVFFPWIGAITGLSGWSFVPALCLFAVPLTYAVFRIFFSKKENGQPSK